MPAVTINGVAFSGTVFQAETVRRAPFEATMIPMPITAIVVGKDGTRNKFSYGTKYRFAYEWKKVPQATRDALWTIRALTGTFSLVHSDSASYTVQIEEEGDYEESVDHTAPNGACYYTIKLVMHQP